MQSHTLSFNALLSMTLVALATAIPAQTTAPTKTLPSGYLKVVGNAGWGAAAWYGASRTQILYSPTGAGTGSAAVALTDLWIRADEWQSYQAAHSYDVEIIVSSKGSKWKTPSRTSFAGNHGTDKRVFFKRAKVSFPKTGASQSAARPWSIHFKGNAKFIAMKGEGLVIDVKTYGKLAANIKWHADAVQFKVERGGYRDIKNGCPTNFGHGSSNHYVGAINPWFTFGFTQGLGDLAFTWLGVKETKIKITGACTLFTLPIVFHPKIVKTTTSKGNTFSQPWIWGRLPASAGGKKLFSQVGAVTTKGQLKLSMGIEVHFGQGAPQATAQMVYGYGLWPKSFDPDKNAPLGQALAFGVIFGHN